MNDLKKQIKDEGYNYAKDPDNDALYSAEKFISFRDGAESEAAKNYWQQEMYSELEIANMIAKLGEYDTLGARWLAKWFNKNKKKL